MKFITKLAASVFLIQFLLGCQSSEFMQVSADTYIITKSDAGPLATLANIRSEAMKEVNEFANKQGKIAVAVSSKSVSRDKGIPFFEYQFRLMDKDDPRAQGVSLNDRPDIVVESYQKIDANLKVEPNINSAKSGKIDIYSELTKLDDLRKRGLITDTEYESEKKKILNSNGGQ